MVKKVIFNSLFVLGFQVLFLPVLQAQYATALTVTDISNAMVSQKINTSVSALLTEFNKAFFENRTPSLNKISGLSEKGRSDILAMWETAPFRCIETEIIERGYSTRSGWQVRNIPMYLKNVSEDDIYQEIVINFDKQGNIENIFFAIAWHQYSAIMNSGNEELIDRNRRFAILDFVENFKTAYIRKDIGMIGNMFSDYALIITGKKIEQGKTSDNVLVNSGFSKGKIEYQKQTKQEYIKRLQMNFSRNAYINVIFENIEVSKHPKHDNIYGVKLKQAWNSSTYSDLGWLFLVIEFKSDENMIIHVRTWQPEDPNKPLPKDEIFQLNDFKIN